MQTVYLLGISSGLLFIFFLVSRKNWNHANMILLIWVVWICLSLVSSYLLATGLMSKYPHFVGMDLAFPFLCGPFLYLYVRMIRKREQMLRKVDFVHFIPFLMYFTLLLATLYVQDSSYKLAVLRKEVRFMPLWMYTFANVFSIVQSVVYSTVTFSNLWNAKFNAKEVGVWLKIITGFMVFINLLFFGVVIQSLLPGLHLNIFHVNYLSLSFIVLVYGIVLVALWYPSIFRYQSLPKDNKYAKSFLSTEKAEDIWNRLLDVMAKEKPYLNSNLTINDLAKRLGVLNKTLSQVVNEKSGGNFSRFLNRYRVNEFKHRVKGDVSRQFTLEAIARDCGFATKTSFHTVFKREESITPAAYLKGNQPVVSE